MTSDRAAWTAYLTTTAPVRPSKYHAEPTEVNGLRFSSKREARRYLLLLWLVEAGEIHNLELQPAFPLWAHGVLLGKYIADFRYRLSDGRVIVEDAKGVRTPLYRWKRKHVAAQYGITISEV